MAVSFEIVSDIDAVFDHWVTSASTAKGIVSADLIELGHEINDIVEPAIAAHTPVVTGALRDSTRGDVQSNGGDGITIAYTQDAQNEQGQEYARFVVDPHRIVAWGHDTGRMYPGNPYPTDALDEVTPTLDALLEEKAHGMAAHVVTVWR